MNKTIRNDFPILQRPMNGKRLAFLDSASSAQKPQSVIDAMAETMQNDYANIHRGLYQLSQDLTARFEVVRAKVAEFIGAPHDNTIVFTRNTTEAINLVAQSWGRVHMRAGDEIILTQMEHHANIVPWQLLAEQIGVVIKVIPVLEDGTLDMDAYRTLLSSRTRFVSVVHASNALGTINPVDEIIKIAKAHNPDIKTLIDGTQAVVHCEVDLAVLGADFYTFTGHKLYGPTGIGVLYGKYDVLNSMAPYQGGGDMIETVSFDGTTFKEPPFRFEAGTPPIVEVIGLGAAIDYVSNVGAARILAHEDTMTDYALHELMNRDDIRVFGTAPDRIGAISFNVNGTHHSDVAMILDQSGVAVRTGHHCCMPLMQRFGIDGTVRASFGLYTNKADIDQFLEGLDKAVKMLG